MTRKQDAEVTPADPAAEATVLMVEKARLKATMLFREVAVANAEAEHARARRELAEVWPPSVLVDPEGARLNPGLAALLVAASKWFLDEQLERIAGPPRPGVPSVDWSPLTRAERDARIVQIDERLRVLAVEVRKAELLRQEAEAADRRARLEAGLPEIEEPEPEPEPALVAASSPTETAIGEDDEDDLGAKSP